MATYVYAVTAAEHPVRLDGMRGVGDPAGALRTLEAGPVSVVVSDAPLGLRPKRRDLMAHEAVLERLLDDGAVLPMRFGLVGPDDDEVAGSVARDGEAYTARLREIGGCLEYHLKASRDEADLLREIVAEVPEARRLNEVTREQPQAQREKVALGEILSREAATREALAAQEITARLSRLAEAHSVGEPSGGHFLGVSFLVHREKAAAFSEGVHQEAARRGDGYELRLHGPLPPYSFV